MFYAYVLADEMTSVFSVSRRGVLSGRGVETQDCSSLHARVSKGAAILMENSWILAADNPMIFDFKLELVGDKGQIQADPSHNGAVRRMTGQGLKYSDLLGIARPGGRGWAALFLESIGSICRRRARRCPTAGRRRGRTSNDPCAGGDRTVSGIWPSGGP